MIRTQVYISRQERDLLRQLAEETGKSKSQMIREALDEYLEQQLGIKIQTPKTYLDKYWSNPIDIVIWFWYNIFLDIIYI